MNLTESDLNQLQGWLKLDLRAGQEQCAGQLEALHSKMVRIMDDARIL